MRLVRLILELFKSNLPPSEWFWPLKWWITKKVCELCMMLKGGSTLSQSEESNLEGWKRGLKWFVSLLKLSLT